MHASRALSEIETEMLLAAFSRTKIVTSGTALDRRRAAAIKKLRTMGLVSLSCWRTTPAGDEDVARRLRRTNMKIDLPCEYDLDELKDSLGDVDAHVESLRTAISKCREVTSVRDLIVRVGEAMLIADDARRELLGIRSKAMTS